jgi:aspartyl/asparaginyl-tRNA synthetase
MKKILFIGISYYAYTERIIQTLESKGYVVTHYPLENRSFWMKTFKKFLPNLYKKKLIQ